MNEYMAIDTVFNSGEYVNENSLRAVEKSSWCWKEHVFQGLKFKASYGLDIAL